MKKNFDLSTIGGRLKFIRKKHNLTQNDLAEMLHIENSSISKMENNKRSIPMDLCLKLLECFGEDVHYVLFEKYPEPTLASLPAKIQSDIVSLAKKIKICHDNINGEK